MVSLNHRVSFGWQRSDFCQLQDLEIWNMFEIDFQGVFTNF